MMQVQVEALISSTKPLTMKLWAAQSRGYDRQIEF
jgi:hypothetical protein